MVDFLNLYLDCLILSKDTVTLFLREGRLEYKTEIFSWNKINTISSKSVLQYLIVDENGEKLSEIKTVKGMIIATETPIIYNNKVAI